MSKSSIVEMIGLGLVILTIVGMAIFGTIYGLSENDNTNEDEFESYNITSTFTKIPTKIIISKGSCWITNESESEYIFECKEGAFDLK